MEVLSTRLKGLLQPIYMVCILYLFTLGTRPNLIRQNNKKKVQGFVKIREILPVLRYETSL